ncbi:tyrosyl-DNA phosphodiesterase [Nitzschia inconspicua]|uniref:Tyrosyl-DNA phosphodiesterase n=1 Tax=Nitzschia inconspicua TaxID=303405 RepID=A0A9K3PTE4_9STRA|nr:tyrosyl-DNA phosphodiesterase [Nitzschia inconspicua]
MGEAASNKSDIGAVHRRRPSRLLFQLKPSAAFPEDTAPQPYVKLGHASGRLRALGKGNRRPFKAVAHRVFLRRFRRRYRNALKELFKNPSDGILKENMKTLVSEDRPWSKGRFGNGDTSKDTTTALKETQSLSCCVVTENRHTNVTTNVAENIPTAVQMIPIKKMSQQDENDSDESYDDELLHETPPPNIVDFLHHEATLCDSPKDRGIVSDLPISNDRLPFGYFQCGQKLYRNKLNDQELLQDGFVALHQLVIPQCQSALMTTFDSGVMMKASIHLACEVCPDVPKVLLVGHGDFLGMPFCGLHLPVAPNCAADKNPKREWFWMACRPFGRSELLMHAKILMFRSDKGLRLVISGNNLTEKQWTVDRDCMWIQDVPESICAQRTTRTTQIGFDEPPMTRLRYFLLNLLKSSAAFYDIDANMDELLLSFVYSIVGHLMDNLDENAVNSKNVRFVYSFPRSESQGGWQQLCQAVWELRHVEKKKQDLLHSDRCTEDDLWYDTDDGDGDNADYGVATLKRINLFAMSGSFGDLKPDFLLQMRMAMSGYRAAFNETSVNCEVDKRKKPFSSLDKSLPWSSIKHTYCLWPSNTTVMSMNPIAILGRCRPMSRKHWDVIPSHARKRVFFDAVPNPDGPSLQSSTESQAAAGFGRALAPTLLGLSLRLGPLSAYLSFAHGKAIFATTMSHTTNQRKVPITTNSVRSDAPYSAVYVGSHNFSKKAWGIRDSRPGNVEFGVVLLTTDLTVSGNWQSRLPYTLPDPRSLSPGNYCPGRCWDVFHRVQYTHTSNFCDDSSYETI